MKETKSSSDKPLEMLRFTKMHGIGNDYVYFNCLDSCPDNLPALSVFLSDRHRGVGGDGIILILPSEIADFKMRIFNADGSEARMCGNGSRCVGKFVYDNGLTDRTDLTLETLSGVKHLKLRLGSDGKVEEVTVDMGAPVLEPASIPVKAADNLSIPVSLEPARDGEKSCVYEVNAVSMGNPHGVVFVESLDNTNVHGIGRRLEVHPMWPDRANIEFAEVISPSEIRMRVWERGSGETQACGTGACATAVAAWLTGRCNPQSSVTIRLLGGDLTIARDPESGHILMTGPATTVFTGEMPVPDLTAIKVEC